MYIFEAFLKHFSKQANRLYMHVCTCITCVVSTCSGEDAYLPAPGEVFDPNEDSLLAELHLATSGSNLPGEVVRGLEGGGGGGGRDQ